MFTYIDRYSLRSSATDVYVLVLTVLNIFSAGTVLAEGPPDTLQTRQRSYAERPVDSPYGCVYLEIGGSGVSVASLHAEFTVYRFAHQQFSSGISHSLRLSAGYALDGTNMFSAAATYLAFDYDHHIEAGVGLASPTKPREGTDALPTNTVGVLIFGYRYEQQTGALLVRATFSPWIDPSTGAVTLFGGLSIGAALH